MPACGHSLATQLVLATRLNADLGGGSTENLPGNAPRSTKYTHQDEEVRHEDKGGTPGFTSPDSLSGDGLNSSPDPARRAFSMSCVGKPLAAMAS